MGNTCTPLEKQDDFDMELGVYGFKKGVKTK